MKPDFDKLARAVADGLTGAIYDDDGQIVCCEILKSYGSPERVEIRVAPAGASGEQECSGTARVTLDLFETVAR